MADFLDKEKWSEIKRGFEFEAAMIFPSDTKRPLSFFKPDLDDPSKGIITRGIGDFSAQKIDGIFRANTQKIVVSIKPRKVVVLSSDIINEGESFEYILVAPINTIKEREKSKAWYSLLTADNHPIFTFLPNKRFPRYIDLTQTIGIHKSLLLKKYGYIGDERLEMLDSNLLECLSLGIIEDEDVKAQEQEKK
ncbi:type II toxin-antitoxin system PemK/MazF family toxin [Sporosarcina sp. G11-34]|uniref:type II toxin-antitoxin system PemK/MazF family toxin n=1 Tax=Sporosarcina sp. G11-34 TaxID=2849605 RepID=UPI0022A95C4D|nr:type II toxin-antitoxin system PemK/MazF family toxin [Sporosarcina sp. G11-34]MCZ2259851.1 type II toxin-antitoxin system PemK/MazF family toxin [Sporosarcina sp. G11-34]